MIVRKAEANWEGGLKDGQGAIQLGEKPLDRAFSLAARFDRGDGTNPEELIGAAHASCFTMSLTKELSDAGHRPKEIRTSAEVQLEDMQYGFSINRIRLTTNADVPGISLDEFKRLASDAKVGCPVSKALRGTLIDLEAKLAGASA